MSARAYAYVNPHTLKYAREEVGYSLEDASKGIVSQEKLSNAEEGKSRLTFNQLLSIANRYKLPVTYFYLDQPVKNDLIEKFRSIRSKDVKLDRFLRNQIFWINNKRDVTIEFQKYDHNEYDYSFINSVKTNSDPKEIANYLMKFIKFEKPPHKWKNEYEAMNSWIKLFTDMGILVFQISKIPTQIMRGFSISKIPYPTIALNRKDSPLGRIYTLIHELVHLSLVDEHYDIFLQNDKRTEIERFCNKVAAEILIPEEKLLSLKIIQDHTSNFEWSETELERLKKYFWISKEALLIRLMNFSLTTRNFYKVKVKEWSNLTKKSGFEFQQHIKVIRTNSDIFLKNILTAFTENEINSSKLSRILKMKLKHLEPLEKEFWK